MILIYREVKKRREAKKRAAANPQVTQGHASQPALVSGSQTQPAPVVHSQTQPSAPNGSSDVPAPEGSEKKWHLSTEAKWNLLLMVALMIPVFLETLDYTGRGTPLLDRNVTNMSRQ